MEISSQKKLQKTRRLKHGLNAGLLTVSVILSAFFLLGLLDRHHKRFDFTSNREFSLSEQAKSVLANLDQELKIVAFFRRGEDMDDAFIKRKVGDVLRELSARSPKIDFKMVDPDLDVTTTLEYGVSTDGTIVFQSGTQKKEIYKSQLFDFSHAAENATPMFVGEGLFINAILKVTQSHPEKICVTAGHGERGLEGSDEGSGPEGFSSVKDFLSKNNYEVQVFSGISPAGTLSSCSLLIVPGATKAFTPPEDQQIRDWIEKKEGRGRLLLLIDPLTPVSLPKTLELLKVEPQNDMVFDTERHFILGPHYPAPNLGNHPITKDLQKMNPILATVRSLKFSGENFSPLLTTSPQAWGETDLDLSSQPKFDETRDHKGPLTLAVAVTRPQTSSKAETQETRTTDEEKKEEEPQDPFAVIVGDADFVSNGLIHVPGNLDLFLNMVGWLVGDKDQVTIRPQTPEFRNVTVTQGMGLVIKWFTLAVYPVGIMLAGGVYWYRRRKS